MMQEMGYSLVNFDNVDYIDILLEGVDIYFCGRPKVVFISFDGMSDDQRKHFQSTVDKAK